MQYTNHSNFGTIEQNLPHGFFKCLFESRDLLSQENSLPGPLGMQNSSKDQQGLRYKPFRPPSLMSKLAK